MDKRPPPLPKATLTFLEIIDRTRTDGSGWTAAKIRDAMRRGTFTEFQFVELSGEVIRDSLTKPILRDLLVTRIGFHGRSVGHYIPRPEGSLDHIFLYCVQGRGFLELGNHRYAVGPETAIFLPKGVPHNYGAEDQDPWSTYWIHFTGRQAGDYFDLLDVGIHRPLVKLPVTPGLLGAIEAIQQPMSRTFTTKSLTCASGALSDFLCRLLVHHEKTGQRDKESRDRVQATITFMEEHLGAKPDLKVLARMAAMSVNRYLIVFRKLKGVSPVAFHNGLKLDRAARLLTTTSLGVAEISEEIGIEDPYYFSRAFKKKFGLAPIPFRRTKMGG